MNRTKIAEKLVELRGDTPQNKVAQDIGISVSALSMYESGERIPRDEIKVALARKYNTTVENIFFRE